MKVASLMIVALSLCIWFPDPIQAKQKPKPKKFCLGKDGNRYEEGEGYEDREGKACIHYKCIKKNKKFTMKNRKCVEDGGWSSWSSWSACSATCGNGTKTRKRTCSSPAPSHGGSPCKGNETQREDCTSDTKCINEKVDELQLNFESLKDSMQSLKEFMMTIQSTAHKQGTCMSDLASSDCPDSAPGKIGVVDGINTNKDGINTNKDGINTNKDGVNTNKDGINTNKDDIKANKVAINDQNTATTTSTTTTTTKAPTACPEIGINYNGDDIDFVRNIPNWQSCARSCSELAGCSHWTWVTPDYSGAGLRNFCFRKSGGNGRTSQSGVISGLSTCQVTWTPGVWLNDDASQVTTNIGEETFNSLFASCPVVRYTRNDAVNAVYKRTSPVPSSFNAFKVFTDTWASQDNQLGTDFKLYSSVEEAEEDEGAWTFCNYDDADVGFPRDCGPGGKVGNQFFSMPGGRYQARGVTSGIGFDIYTGSMCLVSQGCELIDNMYWSYGDFGAHVAISSIEECCKLCKATEGCTNFSVQKSPLRCYKKRGGNRQGRGDFISSQEDISTCDCNTLRT